MCCRQLSRGTELFAVERLHVQSLTDENGQKNMLTTEQKSKVKCPVLLVVYLILELIIPVKASVVQGNVTTKPLAIKNLLDNGKDIRSIDVTATICDNQTYHSRYMMCKSADISIFEPLDEKYDFISPGNLHNDFDIDKSYCQIIDTDDTDYCFAFNCHVLVKGHFLGMSMLDCTFFIQRSINESDFESIPVTTYPISVILSDRKLNRIFIGTLTLMIIVANVLMGCELNLEVVYTSLKKPIAVTIGLACQFVLMPVIAFGIAQALLIPEKMYTIALGLFTAGCAPGGGASNFWTILLKGNADLSITMTFISTICSLAMMPFWMFALGESLLSGSTEEGTHIVVPYTSIIMNLAVLIVPLLFGVLFRRCKENWAVNAKKGLRPIIIFIMVFILTFGVYANLYMFSLMEWRVLGSGLMLPWCGFMFGCLTALAFRLNHFDVAAISIETGVQNSGVAIMLLKASFVEPVSDISSVVPVVVSLFTPIPLMIAMALHWLARKRQPKDSEIVKEVINGEKKDESKPLNGTLRLSEQCNGNGTIVTTENGNLEHQV